MAVASVAHVKTATLASRLCLPQNVPLSDAWPRVLNPPLRPRVLNLSLNVAPPRLQLRKSSYPRKMRKNPRKKTNQNILVLCNPVTRKYLFWRPFIP